MKIFIGADHRGYELKEKLKPWLASQGYTVIDCGNAVYDKTDDYPDFAFAVADRVAALSSRSVPGAIPPALGIVICGSGVGVTIAANKVGGARCSTATTSDEVKRGREDDDLNVLALSADYLSEGEIQERIRAYLETRFTGDERHVRRLKKIEERETHG